MSSQMRGHRPSMFDPIDPKELQQALYTSASTVGSYYSSYRVEIISIVEKKKRDLYFSIYLLI